MNLKFNELADKGLIASNLSVIVTACKNRLWKKYGVKLVDNRYKPGSPFVIENTLSRTDSN
ncbi:MAG: hypothetical protein PHT07_01005 [Paludibacter sp.]|nr:hypothetical protein [Paludibacter sp.]